MKVLHIIHSLRKGGAERVVLELSLGLMAKDYDVTVIGLVNTNEYSEDRYDPINVHFLLKASEYHWPFCVPRLVQKLKKTVRYYDPDVIEVHSHTAMLIASLSNLNTPAVCVFHGYGSISWPQTFKEKVCQRVYQSAFRRLGANGVVVSPSMAVEAARFFSCPGKNFTKIINGINVPNFKNSESRLPKAPLICMVGTLSKNKKVQDGLKAFSILRRKMPSVKLVLIGDGPFRNVLERLARELGISESVSFLGVKNDISSLLQRMCLLWHLSESEGCPLSVVEAMAAGLPVVASDVRGNRDVVIDHSSGFLVPLGDLDAIIQRTEQVLTDSTLYNRLSYEGRKIAEQRFELGDMINGHIKKLSEICE